MHPADGAEVGHGIGIIHGSQMIAVINSYISGLNCIARSGKCTDATGIGGGSSDQPISTLKIYNNFIEAAGENILFGGSAATIVPTDIEIRRNHLFRPMLWKQDEPGYTPTASGNPYIVKNNFELKNGIRVLFEANLAENTWGGFSQTGYSILITPKNQSSKCSVCASMMLLSVSTGFEMLPEFFRLPMRWPRLGLLPLMEAVTAFMTSSPTACTTKTLKEAARS